MRYKAHIVKRYSLTCLMLELFLGPFSQVWAVEYRFFAGRIDIEEKKEDTRLYLL